MELDLIGKTSRCESYVTPITKEQDMIAVLILLAALALTSIVATIVVVARDGYRARPAEMWRSGLERTHASDQRSLPTRLA